ncbi:hypothetical protein EDD36DRAFT_134243 [Exophiala viscosa]|uniref:Vacuolar ATPase assembly protein VMA22 n=1 Tax=Exophiala viscosa TaxID=2486360 RepID=A0AAN6IGP6_9EURO|nr:hypothetical protein EDD36DRAFT_134243 [Exophiala viscosa]
MATQLPSPPSTPQPESKDGPVAVQKDVFPAVEPEELGDETPLSERLDRLLESYLQLLDTYTILREQLSKDLSAGFFALASSNRNSSLGPGRRYGEEGYDQRMKALRTVRFEPKTTYPSIKAAREEPEISTEETAQVKEETSTEGQPAETPSDPGTQLGGTPSKTKSQENDKQNDSKSSSPSNPTHNRSHLTLCYNYTIHTSTPPPTSKDPLKWYGILVPPPLRQCQTHFRNAVSSTIPDLLSTTSEMQLLEKQIWELRRELGLTEGHEQHGTIAKTCGQETQENGEGDDDPLLSSLSPSKDESTSRKQLPLRKASLLSPSSPTRPAEPRSRILKLG